MVVPSEFDELLSLMREFVRDGRALSSGSWTLPS
jgi:hypothetical protein